MSSSPLNGTANTLPPDEKSTTNPPSAVASPRGNPPLRQNSITINTAIAADTAGHGTHGTASDALTPAFTTPIQPTPLVGRWADYWGDPNPQAFGNSGGHNGAVGRSGSKQAGSPSAAAAAASGGGEHHEDINHILTETARQVIESVEQERAKSAASHPESPMAAGVGQAEWGTRATPTQHTMTAQATTVTIMQPGAAILVPAGGVAYAQDSAGGVYAIPMMQAMPQGVQHANAAAAAAAAAANAAGGGVTRSIISHHTSHFTPPPPPPPNFFAALQQEERSDAAVEILTLALNRWIEHVEIWLRHHESERPTVACPVLEQFNSVEVWSNKVQAWYSANFIPRAQRQSARRTAKVNHNQARMAAQHQQQGGSSDDSAHQGGGDGPQGGQPIGGGRGGDRRGDRGGRGGPRFAPQQHQQHAAGSAPPSFGQPPASAPFSGGAAPPQSFSVSGHHGARGGGPAGGRGGGAGYPPPQQQPVSHQHQPYGPPQPQQGGWGYPPPQQQAGAPAYAHHQHHHSGPPQAGFGGYPPPHGQHQQRWGGPPPSAPQPTQAHHGGFGAPHGAGPAHGSPYLQQPPAVQHSLQPGSGRPFDTRTRMVDE